MISTRPRPCATTVPGYAVNVPLPSLCNRCFTWRHVVVCGANRLKVSYRCIFFSHSKQDVPIDSLAALLEHAYFSSRGWAGKHKLVKAIACSSAVVAAYAREEDLLRHSSVQAGGPGNQHAQSSGRSELKLVGFVRASSDGAFAATIHNLIVHPDARDCGIGRNLLRRITAQIYKQGGVTDVGMLAPTKSWGFLQKASFDEDRENSIPMRFPPVSKATEPLVF